MKNIVNYKEFEKEYDGKSFIALGRELYMDLETPVSIFLKVSNGANSFLLESVEGGESIARYSFIGIGGYEKFDSGNRGSGFKNPLNLVSDLLGNIKVVKPEWMERFFGGLIGYISYDAVKYFDDITLPNDHGLDLQREARPLLRRPGQGLLEKGRRGREDPPGAGLGKIRLL